MKTENVINPKQNIYIYGIDGLRALAVIMVLAYHLKLPFAQGGLLGVTVFFVISGFLITRILISQLETTGTIDLKTFWFKRIRRLYPAILAMVIPLILISAIFNRVLFTKACSDLLPTLLGFNNWWQILKNVSYFENAGSPSPLTHCWSLAIETQFYLLYPLLLLALSKLENGKKISARVTLALAVISALLLAILFNPAQDPTRVYYGTDTRAFSLLIGAFLAFNTQGRRIPKKAARFYESIGVIAVIILLYMMIAINGYSSLLYRGGHALASVLSALVILATLNKASLLGKCLSCSPLKWIGDRSYSIYLWHYPIILLISGGAKSNIGITLLEILLSIILAAISYRFIETPIRHGAIGETLKILRSRPRSRRERRNQIRLARKGLYVCSATFVLVLSSLLCICFVPRKTALTNITALEKQAEEVSKITEAKKKQLSESSSDVKNQSTEDSLKDSSKDSTKDTSSDTDDSKSLSDLNLLLMGDSVALGASDEFYEVFPNSICDAAIGRYTTESIALYDTYVNEQNWHGDGVIFALGSNGVLYNSLTEVKARLGSDIPFFVLNVRAPSTTWETSNNEEIQNFVDSNDNTYLVDWYTASEGHSEYFYEDQTHLNEEGAKAYINCIKETVQKVLQKEDAKSTENAKNKKTD